MRPVSVLNINSLTLKKYSRWFLNALLAHCFYSSEHGLTAIIAEFSFSPKQIRTLKTRNFVNLYARSGYK